MILMIDFVGKGKVRFIVETWITEVRSYVRNKEVRFKEAASLAGPASKNIRVPSLDTPIIQLSELILRLTYRDNGNISWA